MLDEKLSIALQIAAAMVHLHSHSTMFRDLKPTNIGFDVRGDVKLFDFGLARFLPEDGCQSNDTYSMSGAGSPRYMAPEILSGRPYNIKADVYSFAIVLWEILSGHTPFGFVRERRHLVNFVNENGRPEIQDDFPDSIKSVLVSSFDGCITKRPEMVSVLECIRDVLKTNRRNSDMLSNSYLNRRRSFDSIKPNLFQCFAVLAV